MSSARGRAWERIAWPAADPLRVTVPSLLFGLRLWASVCLALFIAFKLELDNAFWAGTSAAIVCQPSLGASLRKGWFRMIGTIVGGIAIVLLTAFFPQDRFGFFLGLALWVAASAVIATLLRNFSAYAAALAGYTAAIVAGDVLGATGGPSSDVFMLAITRATEIGIGIVSAGIVLAGTSFGGARYRLAALLAAVAAEIGGRTTDMLAEAGPPLTDGQAARRDLVRRVIALDPVIDEVFGESSRLRPHSPVLQRAVEGLIAALAAWRIMAVHLAQQPAGQARMDADIVLSCLPQPLRMAPLRGAPERWTADPARLQATCAAAIQSLGDLPATTPSLRLLADKSADTLAGFSKALDGLILLLDQGARPVAPRRRMQIAVADWLPIVTKAIRAFLAVGAIEVFWIITEWPSGGLAITFTAIGVVLFALRENQAYALTMSFLIGTILATPLAGMIKFALLPGMDTNSFMALCLALAIALVPAGTFIALPWQVGIFTGVIVDFVPLLSPSNVMVYDTQDFYNTALAILVGIGAAALSFRLMPPLSPARATRRLLMLTLRDLRRLSAGRSLRTPESWEDRLFARLAALPESAEPVQRGQLVAAFSVGAEICRLRHTAAALGVNRELDAALAAIARGDSRRAIASLDAFDRALAGAPEADADGDTRLRARGRILVVSEALTQHATYFDGRVAS